MDKTVGEVIDEKVKEYCEMYNHLREDEDPELRKKARALAMAGPSIARFKADRVYERVQAYIDKREGNCEEA